MQPNLLLDQLKGKSRRECDRILAEAGPEIPVPKERERMLAGGNLEVRMVLTPDQQRQLCRVKELLAHKNPDTTTVDLIEELVAFYLAKKDLAAARSPAKVKSVKAPEVKADPEVQAKEAKLPPAEVVTEVKTKETKNHLVEKPIRIQAQQTKKHRVAIPIPIKRQVFIRDGGRCIYKDPKTGKICGSAFGIELDHIQPVALDGENTVENLRCLCKAHNQLMAVWRFGESVSTKECWR